MRSGRAVVGLVRRAGPLLLGLLGLLGSQGGCRPPRTELLLGLATDLKVPDDIDRVIVVVQQDGEEIERRTLSFSGDERAVLPGTLALFTTESSPAPLEVQVIGYLGEAKETNERLRRTAVVSLVAGKTLFLRLTLVRACLGPLTCGDGLTCVEGQCELEQVDASRLPAYQPGMEKGVQCPSETQFTRTDNGQPLPQVGQCRAQENCIEGTCYPRPLNELQVEVATDLIAPDQIDRVVLVAERSGVEFNRREWRLARVARPDSLPARLRLYTADGSTPTLALEAIGYRGTQVQVRRRAEVPLVNTDETMFLRLGLVASCVGRPDCPAGQTCIEGRCALSAVDPTLLRAYTTAAGVSRGGLVECSSGTQFIDTGTRAPLAVASPGQCKPEEACTEGLCYGRAPSLCGDGLRDGSETDVDCGGGGCPLCTGGRGCITDADCASGSCGAGTCAYERFGFPGTVDVLVGRAPVSVALGDLNGDGRLDLAVANRDNDNDEDPYNDNEDVSVLIGLGGGRFAPPSYAAAGRTPRALALGDLNGDQILDLAVANRDSGEVSVLLGQGNGGLGPPQSFPVGTTPFGIALGDLNGDDRLDVVVANRGSGDVSVLLNQGGGAGTVSFAAQARYGAGTTPTAVAIADVDGDDRPELAVTDADGGVSVLFQPYAGGGVFDPGVFYATTAGRSSAVAVQDLDGDGRLDLAIANLGYDMGMEGRGGNVDVLLNQGNGTFRPAMGYLAGQGPFALAIADIDEDRRVDLVVANQLSNDVHVLRNQGSGTFAMPRVYPTGLEPYAVAVGDLNDDEHLDLAVANAGYNRTRGDISVLLNRGQGTFAQAVSYPAGQRPAALAVADFDRDGRIDVAVANAATDDVILLQGQLGGSFRPAGAVAAGENPGAMAVGDLNADDRPDLVVVGPPRGPGPGGGGGGGPDDRRLHVLLGQDGGRFAPRADYQAGPNPAAVALADLDADGDRDLAVGTLDGQVLVFRNQGNAQVLFDPPTTYGAGRAIRAIAVGDLDGNGQPDLVVADAGAGVTAPGGVAVLLALGNGAFSPTPVPYLAGRGPTGLALVDLDGDTRLDLVVASHDSDEVNVLYGRAGGTFELAVPLTAGRGPRAVAVGDFNGDGRLDLGVANELSNDVSVLRSTGSRAFAAALNYRVGTEPAAVAAADANGDRRLDLIVASTITNDVTVLINQGDGSYAVMATLPAVAGAGPRSPSAMVSGDLNGDGFSDLVVAAGGASEVHIFRGLGGTRFDPVSPPIVTEAAPTALAIGDVSGDGLLDLAVGHQSSREVRVFLGQPGGGLDQGTDYESGNGASAVALADLDGDGRLDLIVAHAEENNFTVQYNGAGGAGLFGPAMRFPTGARPSALGTGDFDGDGRTDVAVAVADGAVNLFFNMRDGRINYVGNLNVGRSPRALAVADLDNDGQPDLATANEDSADVSVLLNRGRGSFVAQTPIEVGSRPNALAIRDLNGDSRPDLVTANADDTVRVFLNAGGSGFQTETARILQAGARPVAVVLEDFNRDSRPDLAVANAGADSLTLLLNLSR